MNNNNLFIPINNQYKKIDLLSLKLNNYKTPTLKRKSIDLSPVLEISKYNQQLQKDNNKKEEIILNSKQTKSEEINLITKKSRYYEQIDMLNYIPNKMEMEMEMKDSNLQTVTQNYLKSFTTLDIPLAQNQNILYEFNSKTLNSKILNENVYKILEYSFFEMDSIISKPYFLITPENVIINLFYFIPKFNIKDRNFLDFNMDKLQGLSDKLSRYFKKPVKFDLTQLYSVSHNSQILINILGKLGLSRRNSFTRIIGRFLKNQSSKMMFRGNLNKFSRYATILTGVNIKLGGRLRKGKIVPRRTVKKIQYGSLARSKSNYITTARLTQKNKRGAFSFTVSIGHKIF